MNSILSRNVVELLDRKYSFVESTTDDMFPLDLKHFVDFLDQNELIKPFAEKLLKEVKDWLEQYNKKLALETEKAVDIRDMLIKGYPEMDDSSMKPPEGAIDSEQYDFSLANFNNYVNGARTKFGYFPIFGMYADESSVAALIRILRIKINDYEGLDRPRKRKMDNEIHNRLTDLESMHKHTHREWINFRRISPGCALDELIGIAKSINPEPEDWTKLRKMSTHGRFNYVAMQYQLKTNHSTIRAIVYGDSEERPLNRTTDQQRRSLLEKIKILLKRVYEAIRQEIGTTQLYLHLINRYRLRSQWYNQTSLIDLVTEDNGNYKSNREDLLTKDLALFLFDNGVTAQYRIRFGKHEFDLLGIDVEDPIFIEAKAYKDSGAKRELIDGVAQLHSYLSNIEGYKSIREAYYVVYRLAGSIYEFPEMINTNRFTIFPVLVDLGLSQESGRKQPKPILIKEEEILSRIEQSKGKARKERKES
jgi:hypothetical protein